MGTTPLAAPIAPSNSAPIPTHYAQYGFGGWRSVADTTARDAVPAYLREQGMAVFVTATNTLYLLNADRTTWTSFSGGASAFAGLTGTWSLAQVDGTGTAAKYLRGDKTWAVPAFSEISGVATLAQLPTGTGFLVAAGGSPTYRALVAADIPDISATYLTVAVAAATYLTLSSAAATYLTLSSAAATYATRSAITGTGYYKGSGTYPGAFVTTIALADLANSGGAAGDLAYWSGTAWTRLAVGSSSQVLKGGTTPGWSSVAFSELSGTATLAQLPTGTGYLKGSGAAPAYTATIALADLANSGGSTGDVAYWNGSNWVRLAIGASGTVLKGGTTPSYAQIVNADVSSSAAINCTKTDGAFGATDVGATSGWVYLGTDASGASIARSRVTRTASNDNTVKTLDSFTIASDTVVGVVATVEMKKAGVAEIYRVDLNASFVNNGGTVSQVGTTAKASERVTTNATSISATIDFSGTTIRVRLTPRNETGWVATCLLTVTQGRD